MNTRALILRDLGRYNEALKYFMAVLKSQRNTFGKNHSSVALTLHNIETVRADQGDLRGAIELIKESLIVFEKNGLFAYCARASEYLAGYYQELNETEAAISSLRKALFFLEAVHGARCTHSMDVRYRLGNLIF